MTERSNDQARSIQIYNLEEKIMTDELIYGNQYADIDWGCDFREVISKSPIEKIKICHVHVNDMVKVANELAAKVLDTSWMMNLDAGSRRAYNRTVNETAQALVSIFQGAAEGSSVGSEFGETLVSIGSAQALEVLFEHLQIPVAELWKPQLKQNEGFDFHTICPAQIINFGEAKYSGSSNPHGNAINQAKYFIDNEKHLRDRVHLVNLVSNQAIDNLDNDNYGVVAAFSINSSDPLLILKNAIQSSIEKLGSDQIKSVYLIGVTR